MLRRLGGFLARHPISVGLATVVVVAGGYLALRTVAPVVFVPDVEVDWAVPDAPTLTPTGDDQTVFHIDSSRSSVTYEVEERLVGQPAGTATGTTHGIAGDILVDRADPAASTLGPVVVNVEQFTSDHSLRDRRIRVDFLESDTYPITVFTPTAVEGLPAALEEGSDVPLTVTGDLTVKTTTAPVDLDATARLDGDELHISGTADLRMSTFDVGPISIAGLVSTGDEMRLRFDLVAVDGPVDELPTTVPPPEVELVATDGSEPSFVDDIQPLLEANCASCHNTGGVGAHVWPLDTAGDAVEVADGLGVVVRAGFMPPWPPSDAGVALQHPMELTEDEIDELLAWVEAGAPLDTDATAPVEAAPTDVPTPEHDLVVRMAEAYPGDETLDDEYRCFVLDPELTEPVDLVGFEFLPGEESVVHHALAWRLSGSYRDDATAKADEDQQPGWQCFGGMGLGDPRDVFGRGTGGVDQIMAWAPGQRPVAYPDGVGLPMAPDDFLVVQIHYHFDHEHAAELVPEGEEPEPFPADRSAIALDLADEGSGALRPLHFDQYLAPAEIPCSADEDGPLCDRDAAIAALAEEYGLVAAIIPNRLLQACGSTPEDYAHFTDGVAEASCDHVIRREGEIFSVAGHMHELGQSFRMTLHPDTPEETVLLDIPTWDFGWQLNYTPVDPVRVEPGDVVRIECTWDRSLRVEEEPRYVTWSEGTVDEMCFSTMTVVPDG